LRIIGAWPAGEHTRARIVDSTPLFLQSHLLQNVGLRYTISRALGPVSPTSWTASAARIKHLRSAPPRSLCSPPTKPPM
jgi:hypothetical protein